MERRQVRDQRSRHALVPNRSPHKAAGASLCGAPRGCGPIRFGSPSSLWAHLVCGATCLSTTAAGDLPKGRSPAAVVLCLLPLLASPQPLPLLASLQRDPRGRGPRSGTLAGVDPQGRTRSTWLGQCIRPGPPQGPFPCWRPDAGWWPGCR